MEDREIAELTRGDAMATKKTPSTSTDDRVLFFASPFCGPCGLANLKRFVGGGR